MRMPAGTITSRKSKRPARKVEDRCGRILASLANGKELPVEALIAQTGASPATVRRDLRTLEEQGLVRRAHGVVAIADSKSFEPFLADPGFRDQVRNMAAEKRRIGAAAAALVEEGATIGLAAGTTVAQMTRQLKSYRELTIVTNALNVGLDLSRQKQLTVHLTGGYLSGNWFALVGPKALEFISTIFIDTFFFGANGIDHDKGVTDHHQEEAAANQALARQAGRRILLADHTKLGHTARHLVCETRSVTTIITDSGATDDMIAPFERLGIEVIRV
jgi:DeoR family transcriptional regulator of aga operon